MIILQRIIQEEVLFTLCKKCYINLHLHIQILTSVLDIPVKTVLHVKIFPVVTCAGVKQVLQEGTARQVSQPALFISNTLLLFIYPFWNHELFAIYLDRVNFINFVFMNVFNLSWIFFKKKSEQKRCYKSKHKVSFQTIPPSQCI